MPLPSEKHYTYEDLLNWEGDERYELIDGTAYLLASPTFTHQRTSVKITQQISDYLEGKRCEVISAPFDVRLFEKKTTPKHQIDTVVQPDIMVVCDKDKLDEHGCMGAPDMVVEILSPSTDRRDRFEKYLLYQRARVKEYWIVDPDRKSVLVYLLENDVYHIKGYYDKDDKVQVNVLKSCYVDLSRVFEG